MESAISLATASVSSSFASKNKYESNFSWKNDYFGYKKKQWIVYHYQSILRCNQCWKLLNENKPKTLGLFRKVVYFLVYIWFMFGLFLAYSWVFFEINQISFKRFGHRGSHEVSYLCASLLKIFIYNLWDLLQIKWITGKLTAVGGYLSG